VTRNSHAIKRDKKGAGSAISATSPREFAASSDRGQIDKVAGSAHSRDALLCQPEGSENRSTAGGISGQQFVAFRGVLSEPVHGAWAMIFGSRITPPSGVIFTGGLHGFRWSSIASVTFLVRHLWQTKHARRPQADGPFATRRFAPKHCLGDTSIRLLLTCFPQPMGVDRKDYTLQVVSEN